MIRISMETAAGLEPAPPRSYSRNATPEPYSTSERSIRLSYAVKGLDVSFRRGLFSFGRAPLRRKPQARNKLDSPTGRLEKDADSARIGRLSNIRVRPLPFEHGFIVASRSVGRGSCSCSPTIRVAIAAEAARRESRLPILADLGVSARLRALRGPGESYSDVILRLDDANPRN